MTPTEAQTKAETMARECAFSLGDTLVSLNEKWQHQDDELASARAYLEPEDRQNEPSENERITISRQKEASKVILAHLPQLPSLLLAEAERDEWHAKYKAVTQSQESAFKAWLANRDQLRAELATVRAELEAARFQIDNRVG